MKVFAADVVINPSDSTFHKSMAAFGGICVGISTGIFFCGMTDLAVTCIL